MSHLKKISNWIVVFTAVLLVALPVLSDQMRAEVARWQLAAAANAAVLGTGDVDALLRQVSQQVENLDEMRDYWLFRIKRALAESPATAPKELQAAIDQNSNNRTLTRYTASWLWARKEFEYQVRALEIGYRKPDVELPASLLNELAYSRALASLELDQALEDINAALEDFPNEAAYRDTRAWVLFRMGRPLEALEDADFAVQAIEQAKTADWVSSLLSALADWLESSRAPEDSEETLTQRDVGQLLWAEAVLHYHRASILEALGRSEQAAEEWQWLRDRQLPQDDRLY